MRKIFLSLLICVLPITVVEAQGKKKNKGKKVVKDEVLTPLEQKFEEGKMSKVTCRVLGKGPRSLESSFKYTANDYYNYHVYIPEGYYKDKAKGKQYPFIVVDSPGGGAQKQLKLFKNWAAENKVIVVMLVEARNYTDTGRETQGNYLAAMNDLKSRFSLAKKSGVMTGFSGGGRRASVYSYHFKDQIGAVLQAGGANIGDQTFSSVSHIFSATVSGDCCFNVGETFKVESEVGKRGYYSVFKGAHSWYTKTEAQRALDWLLYKMAMRSSDRLPKEILERHILALLARVKKEKSVIMQDFYLSRIQDMVNFRADVEYLPRFKKLPYYLRGKRAHLSKSSGFSKEKAAKQLYDKYFLEYSVLGHSEAIRTGLNGSIYKAEAQKAKRVSEGNRKKAVSKMKEIMSEYPQTYGATLASKEIERLESLATRILKAGYGK